MDSPDFFAFKNKVESEAAAKVAKSLLPEVYRRIRLVLSTYMDMNENDKDLVVLWIIGTYLYKDFPSFPRLFINAMKGSGKSRLLQILQMLCWNGSVQTNLTEAVLFRSASKGTLLFDESESIGSKEKGALRELLNAGYKKGVAVKRMKKNFSKEGENLTIESFDLYGPVALANINGMEDVLGDRCINITLEKSNDDSKTKLIEDFDKNPIILDIKRTLELILVYKCSVVVGLETVGRYNLYILYTLNTLTTLTTQTTHNYTNNNMAELYFLKPLVSENSNENNFIFDDWEKSFYDKILSLNINGRNLELFMPLYILAMNISKDLLDSFFIISSKYVQEKNKEESIENRDWSLIDWVSKQEQTLSFIPVSQLVFQFKEFYNSDDNEWLNTKWIGQALKRLKLVLDKRRVGHGVEVILNVAKAKEKIKQIKKDEPVKKEVQVQ